MQITSYLPFVNGNCAEALALYEQALNGKIDVVLKARDTPMSDGMPPELRTRSCTPKS